MAKQLNTPIYADIKYGDEEHIGNLALWAYQLEFVHPVTKEIMKFSLHLMDHLLQGHSSAV